MQVQSMTPVPSAEVAIRTATTTDGERCGEIVFDAFASIATRHNFPIEPGSPDFTHFKASQMLSSEGFVGLVAQRDGRVLGCAFNDERDTITGLDPIVVDPAVQDVGLGRALMEESLRRQRERQAVGVRLIQTAYHYRSLALDAKLGFVVREPLSVLHGTPPAVSVPGRSVRPADGSDLVACGELCMRVHGHHRNGELSDAITDEDMIALLGAAEQFMGLGFLVPSRNSELLAWCLNSGLRIVQQSTLMTIGLYNAPTGAWLPSIVY